MRSTLEIINVATRERRVVHQTAELIEAPNWSKDNVLYYNGGGLIYRRTLIPGSKPEQIDTGSAIRCNNDHGISPDGTQLVISDQTKDGSSRIYTLPIGGGTLREIVSNIPSYWHGWSPDGSTLAFCGRRDGVFGIFTVPATGGEEVRLTEAPGLDDGPDYSPDGRWIYFNSDRTGHMQIWRMHPDGSGVEQCTFGVENDWFPHPSPDGKWVAFLSYAPDVKGHPADKDVALRMMPLAGGQPEVLATFVGGQGTINVPSWSPDSTHFAFVSYARIG